MNEVEKITNFEKIKSMDIDKMAEFIYRLKDCEDIDCNKCMLNDLCSIGMHDKEDILRWLESEVRE